MPNSMPYFAWSVSCSHWTKSRSRSTGGVVSQKCGLHTAIRWTRYGPSDGSFSSASRMIRTTSGSQSSRDWGIVATSPALATARSAVISATASRPATRGRRRTSRTAARVTTRTSRPCVRPRRIEANAASGSKGPKLEGTAEARNAARMLDFSCRAMPIAEAVKIISAIRSEMEPRARPASSRSQPSPASAAMPSVAKVNSFAA